ncbi:MAG: BlaI/MecI/CopY family transcriptional regulator [Lachnospiraceae bacterium]|jgi:predicted transcriptional regulator|nr:BlaI/MecI/CopY family transcriptional regulator [Lachnospiraceae bacterium]
MEKTNMGTIEGMFADLIWENEPMNSLDLIAMSQEKFGWKRTTTYTVLNRLCKRGVFKLENSVVTACVSRDEFYSAKSENFVNESFKGSLPAFFAAFTKRKKLTKEEIAEIKVMIDAYDKENG